MKTATKQVLVGALAFAFAFRLAQAGGWQNLGAGAKDAVVGFHPAVDPRDTNPQNGGAFVNLDGTIAYDAFFKYTGTITGDVRPLLISSILLSLYSLICTTRTYIKDNKKIP